MAIRRRAIAPSLLLLLALAPAAQGGLALLPGDRFAAALAGAEPVPRQVALRFQAPDEDELDEAPSWPTAPSAPLTDPEAVPDRAGLVWQAEPADDVPLDVEITGEPALGGAGRRGHRPLSRRFLRPFVNCLRTGGAPLDRESIRNRPIYVGVISGGMLADNIIHGRVNSGTGYLYGVRLGWDFTYYSALEMRFAGSKISLSYPHFPEQQGDNNLFLFDVSYVYHPWGDSQWRPFFSIGMGLANLHFPDDTRQIQHDGLFGVPWGLGFKYRWSPRITMRLEVMDNMILGSGTNINTMNSVSITGGLEWHWGPAARRSYWPWNPSRAWW